MSTLRDLIVTIDFNDIDTKRLLGINSAVDEIEKSLFKMGAEIDDTGDEFKKMGKKGKDALGDVEKKAWLAGFAVDDLEDEIDELGDEMKQLGFATMKTTAMVGGLVVAMSALVAASAPVIAGTMALGASFLAAGVAAGGFGVVAAGVLTDLFQTQKDIQKLEEKVAKAKTTKERIAAQKELANALSGVSAAQKGALEDLSEFKGFWKGFTKQFEVPVFKVMGKGLDLIEGILTRLSPSMQTAGIVINEMFRRMNEALNSNKLKFFFDWLNDSVGSSLGATMATFGNVLKGVLGLFVAFSPLQSDMETGMLNLSRRFAEWSTTLSSNPAFQNFIDYAKENGPKFLGLLGNIWDIGKDVVVALAPLGTIVLDALNNLTQSASEFTPKLEDIVNKAIEFGGEVRDNWPVIRETTIGIATALGTLYTGLKALQIIGVINTLFAAYKAGTFIATATTLGFNAALWANPLTWIVAGIAAVVAGVVLLIRNWDLVKTKTMELWDKLGKFKIALIALTGPFGMLIAGVVSLVKNWDKFKESITNFKMPKFGLPKWMGGEGLIQTADGSHATGLGRVPYDGYMAQVHKDEAILTAQQSNALRNAGMLSGDSKPNVNLGGQIQTKQRGNITYAPVFNIPIQGNADSKTVNDIKRVIKEESEKQWVKFQLEMGLA